MIGRKNVMSEGTTLPIWSLGHDHNQGQERSKGKEGNESSTDPIYHQQATFSQSAPMNSFEVAELTWENGQLAMHGFPTKPAWGGRSGDTLESIVHQATICHNNIHSPKPNPYPNPKLSKQEQQKRHQNMETVGSVVASSGEKRTDNPRQVLVGHHGLAAKRRERLSTDYDQHEGRKTVASCNSLKGNDEWTDRSTNDHTTMMTSFESPTSTKTRTTDEDSACHGVSENQEEEREIRSETGRSLSARKGRAAVVHNQSERRRRDKINQKMKALQKLVPNACKTDKASILDEVIDYLKQLQAQVQMFKYMSPPQLMMPIGMQQQLQMSLLASMGMGMGMVDMSRLACPTAIPQPMSTLVHPNPVANNTSSTFVAATPPPFVVPPVIPNSSMPTVPQKPITDPGGSVAADPLQDTYNAMLAHSMNAEVYNRMVALGRQQQINQNTQAAGSIPQSNPAQRG